MKFPFFKTKPKPPDAVLPTGWQFYSRPNNLEPPGTIFRIRNDGTRFIVKRLDPKIDTSPEPGAAKIESIESKMGVVARLLGLESLSTDVSAGITRVLRYEISKPFRLSTTDEAMDLVLKPALHELAFKPGYRYYIIREMRSAAALRFTLSKEDVGDLGVKATLVPGINAGVSFSEKAAGTYELSQTFPQRLGVMFLPDEIVPVRAALAGDRAELGRVPVQEVLDWVESPEHIASART
jgi:hypothetical protein